MNYLLHLLSDEHGPAARRLGNVLGDFARGPLRGNLPAAVEEGVRLHRHLDSAADGLPCMRECRRLLPSRWRRVASVLLDLWFDHLLLVHWERFRPGSPEEWLHGQSTELLKVRVPLPASMEGARRRLFSDGGARLLRYREAETMRHVLGQVSGRLRGGHFRLEEAMPDLMEVSAALTDGLGELLPFLCNEAERWIRSRDSVPPAL